MARRLAAPPIRRVTSPVGATAAGLAVALACALEPPEQAENSPAISTTAAPASAMPLRHPPHCIAVCSHHTGTHVASTTSAAPPYCDAHDRIGREHRVIAILGGVGAALAWALSTLCSSRSSRLIDPLSVVAWMMVVGLVIAAPLAARSGLPARLGPGSAAWLATSGVGNVCGLVLVYRALRVGQVALVAPLVSTEGAIAAMIAVIAGESVAPGVALALLAILGGVWLASVQEEPQPA